ncbi:hypothetical protein [Mesomycoplasma neurolyticum]|uniref:Uncharacterized protein n=1 Tax=Mesomycoplasma neurolyticum TaxID=2120 RepID=A0A449A6I7_9BACT|nr:hypothetical protein [Mesomycoplasma neurolyticum]VEU59848.1 Uncharacterised protein [Mesomycoplasma neurolyticum]
MLQSNIKKIGKSTEFYDGWMMKNPQEADKYLTSGANKALDAVYDSTHWKNNWFTYEDVEI